MRGLVVWQPWASLIALGWKRYEFRSWPGVQSLAGRRIAILAGARQPKPGEIRDLLGRIDKPETFVDPAARSLLESWSIHDYPRRCIVATAVLGKSLPPAQVAGLAGCGNDSDRAAHFNWAWPMDRVRALGEPIPCRGAQGFFSLPADVTEALELAGAIVPQLPPLRVEYAKRGEAPDG